jgi:hypothetical protein
LISLVVAGMLAYGALAAFGLYAMMGGGDSSGLVWGTKLGVSEASGRLFVHVLICPDEFVRDVRLSSSDSSFASSGVTLWEIRSTTRSTVSDFVVGASSLGFVARTRLTVALTENQPLIVEVTTGGNGGGFAIDFHLRDLQATSIYINGPGLLGEKAHVTAARFHSVRSKLCRLQPNGPGG